MRFRLAPITDCQERLRRDYSEFTRAWASVKDHWLDDRCRQFEQEHLSTLGPALNRFSAALVEFSDAVQKADAALADQRESGEGLE